MSDNDWFFRQNDHERGPFSETELQEKVAAGEIRRETLVHRAGREWGRADTFYFLVTAFHALDGSAKWAMSPPATSSGNLTGKQDSPSEKRENRTRNDAVQRLTPVLLMVAIGLLAVSVILQGIMSVAILSCQKPMEVLVTNTKALPVNVANRELDVNVTNIELPVNVRDHYILDADPIPVKVVR